jgi:integrase
MSARGSVYRRGATWTAHVKWTRDGKTTQTKKGGFRTKALASQELTKLLAAVDNGVTVGPERRTFAAYVADWLEHKEVVEGLKPSTARGYRHKLAQYVLPAIGEHRVGAITVEDLNALYRQMARRGLAPATIRQTHAIIRGALAAAERAELVSRNVATRATLPAAPRLGERKIVVWTDEQTAAFLAMIGGRPFAMAITTAAYTGMRRGELIALRWADVDLDSETIVVCRAAAEGADGYVEGTPKSHTTRVVDIGPALVAQLRAHRRRQSEWRLLVGEHWIDDDRVFPAPDGSLQRPDALTRAFNAYSHEFAAATGAPRIRLHDLRHGHATSLVEAGTLTAEVSRRLGHASPAFTDAVYVHPTRTAQKAAAVAYEQRVAQKTATKSTTKRVHRRPGSDRRQGV